MRPRWQLYQGIYIHIPFCVHKCCYCDFASYQIQSPQVMEAYTRRLVEEIRAYEPDLPLSPTATIYFGGGTPSVLPPELLAQIVNEEISNLKVSSLFIVPLVTASPYRSGAPITSQKLTWF